MLILISNLAITKICQFIDNEIFVSLLLLYIMHGAIGLLSATIQAISKAEI